jgi:dienelactone hydrolase
MRRLALVLLPLLLGAVDASAATPPARPRAGLPGGLDSPDVDIVRQAVGRAGAVTYAFYAAGKPDAPRPVAVFLHGWGAVNPVIYGGWIDHLARKGWLVLFPAFQTVGQTRPADATARAGQLVKDALASLAQDPAARPDLTRVGLVGHSAGAGIAVNLAAEARSLDLPVPRLVFAVMPGGIASDSASRGVPLADLAKLDPSTALITMVGDRDAAPADRVSRRMLREASDLPPSKKLFMRIGSDDHGFPTLSATLASPAAPKEGYDMATIKVAPDPAVDPKTARAQRPKWSADMVLSGEQTVLLGQLQRNAVDTLDWLGFWKTFDMASDAVFTGSGDMAALRSDPAFVDMGRWSDGWPVRRLAAETPKAVDPTGTAATPARVAPAPTKMPVTRQRPRPRRE